MFIRAYITDYRSKESLTAGESRAQTPFVFYVSIYFFASESKCTVTALLPSRYYATFGVSWFRLQLWQLANTIIVIIIIHFQWALSGSREWNAFAFGTSDF